MEIYFIRHGKTKGNEEHRYVGRTDEGLSENGMKRLREMAGRYPSVQLIYVSPMRRCCQTAEILYPGVNVMKENSLQETDFGIFEYKNYEELKDNIFYQKWIDSVGQGDIPGGESGAAFRKRSIEGFLKCLNDALEKGVRKIAFVVHGGTIMAIMDCFAGDGCHMYDWQVENGCGYYAGWNEKIDRVRLEHVKRL